MQFLQTKQPQTRSAKVVEDGGACWVQEQLPPYPFPVCVCVEAVWFGENRMLVFGIGKGNFVCECAFHGK